MSKNKALILLKNTITTEERAQNYVERISKSLRNKFIENPKEKRNRLQDRILDLSEELSVEGKSKEDCEKILANILEAEYEIRLLSGEIATKEEVFNEYFEKE